MVHLRMKTNFLTTKEGARLFLALSEASPKYALECLKRTIGTWDIEERLEFSTGRRQVINALEKIAMHRNLFADAAKLLLKLGEAENENWSNNSCGIFVDLFTWVAQTEASSEERFLVLKESLDSSSTEQVILALRACDRALETGSITRMASAGYQGLRNEPQPWKPKTWKELYDSFHKVWQLLFNKLDDFTKDERQQAVSILLKRARILGTYQYFTNIVIDTVSELAKKPYTNKREILATIIQILHYDSKSMPTEILHRWNVLKEELTGSDFSSLMKRYIGMNLLEDEFDEEGERVDQTQSRIEKLAEEVIRNKNLLQTELDWLVTTEAKNGFRFGYELGRRDDHFTLMSVLLGEQQKADEKGCAFFIGGYFRALFERNIQQWERQLDDLVEDAKLNLWIPEITWRSGMTDRAALRILNLAEKKIIDIGLFSMFCLGGVSRNLSENVLKKLVELLLTSADTCSISIALKLYDYYYVHFSKDTKNIMPEELSLQLLTHQMLFQKPESGRFEQREDYHWAQIGDKFIQLYPERSLELADKMLEHFGESGTIFEDYYSNYQKLLHKITRKYPKAVWRLVTKYLPIRIDSRAYHIQRWLQGDIFSTRRDVGMLSVIPLEEIMAWVDEDVENRARHLASFVPNKLFREEGKVCLAREVLVRYGTRKDVKESLIASFSSGGWEGPASLHFQGRLEQLLNYKKNENNENVKLWIDEFISHLERDIKQAKINEERRSF